MLDQKHPAVTFILLAYNQQRFIGEAVRAALAQEYPSLEIIISDDCSTDATYEVIESTVRGYSGPHQLVVKRNTSNRGLAGHFNVLCAQARGEIIVVAAGDDISSPDRTRRSVDILVQSPDAMVVSFRLAHIDADGRALGGRQSSGRPLRRVTLTEYVTRTGIPSNGASRAFRRSIFERFGPLNPDCPTEDSPMLLRGLMLGTVYISDACTVYYRKHGGNLSGLRRLPRLSPENVYHQYLSDIDLAKRQKLLAKELVPVLKNWAFSNLQRRQLQNELICSRAKLPYFARHILWSRWFGARDKLRLLWRALG